MDKKDLFYKLLEYSIDVINAIIDCIEDSLNNMTYPKGHNLLYVVLVILSTIPISILSYKLDKFCFISIDEAIMSSILISIIYLLNSSNKRRTEKQLRLLFHKTVEVYEKGGNEIGKRFSIKHIRARCSKSRKGE